jgi:hypothetical protein
VEVEFDTAPTGDTAITANYEYYEYLPDSIYIFSTTILSDQLGSFVELAMVPDESTEMARGIYYVHGYDAIGNTDSDGFTIGAVISLDVEEGPTGTVVEIQGRGFDPAHFIEYGEITITGGANPIDCCIVDEPPGGVDVNDNGDFQLEIVIPQVDDIDDYDTIEVTDGYTPAADAEFEVTGLAKIEVDPDFGLPGSTINIKGCNFTQISGEEVSLELWDPMGVIKIVDIDVYETDGLGEFSGSFIVPAISSGVYTLMASQEGHGATDDYNIHVDTSFSIHFAGIVVVVTPSRGPTGTEVTLTGTGFTADDAWNASFGDISIFDSELTDGTGSLCESFIVPTVDVGTYTVTVLDEDAEIEVETEYTVTATTKVELHQVNAPNNYNATLEGWYFTGIEGTEVEAVLYNVTDDGDVDKVWVIALKQMWDHDNDPDTPRVVRDAETDEDGNFTAYWYVPDEDILSVGDFILNVTTENPGDGPDLFARARMGIVDSVVKAEPRKTVFFLGETLSFQLVSYFRETDSYIEVKDPYGSLYWRTDDFSEFHDWVRVGDLRTFPYQNQTSGGKLMHFSDDAPLGIWSWTWYEREGGDVLGSGTFAVSDAAPGLSIYSDMFVCSMGNTTHLGLNITNYGPELNACLAIWLEKPGGGIQLIIHAHSIMIPAGLQYSNPKLKTILLPSIPTGLYTWHVALLNPSTHGIINEDTATWVFI